MLLSLLPSMLVLGTAAMIAGLLALRRTPRDPDGHAAADARSGAARALTAATALQAAHLVEETATGFTERLAALLNLPVMPFWLFLTFNLAWIAAWLASIRGVRSGRRAAMFAAWFLAIAGLVNGVAHPALAVADGGYFPGLATVPFIAGAAGVLWFRLWQVALPPAPAVERQVS